LILFATGPTFLSASPVAARTPSHPQRHMARLTVLLASLLLSAPACAQSVSGTVLDDDSDQPVRAVLLELRSSHGHPLGSAVTDSLGMFHLQAPEAGTFSLRARRIGYQDVESPGFAIAAAEAVEVHLAIASTNIPLAPLTITSRPEPPRSLFLERVGFYRRQYRNAGTFLPRERIERTNGARLSDLLSEINGVRKVMVHGVMTISLNRQRNCSPQVVLDGQPLVESTRIDDIVSLAGIEAIEIYRGPAEAPAEYAMRETGCGLLLIWTRSRR
jgi:hypothetical protein